jgi:hypothetical protein
MQKCKQCEWEFPDDIRICPYCGHPAEPEDKKQKRRFNLQGRPNLPGGVKQPLPGLQPSQPAPTTPSKKHIQLAIIVSTIIVALVLTGVLWARAILAPTSPQDQTLTVSPSLLDFGPVRVGSKPVLSVIIMKSSESRLNWQISPANVQWLQIALRPKAGQSSNLMEDIYNVTANTSKLNVGKYSAYLQFSSEGGRIQQVTVKIQVVKNSTPAKLNVSPLSLDFGSLKGGNQKTLPLTVGNSGGQELRWTADKGKTLWLTLDHYSGKIAAGAIPQSINVLVDTATLRADHYTTTINFSSDGRDVPVAVKLDVTAPQTGITVKPSPSCINVTPRSLTFIGAVNQNDPPSQSVIIRNCGTTMGTWSAATSTNDNANWLYIRPNGGVLEGGAIKTITITTSNLVAQLPAGMYTGKVTFTMGSSSMTVQIMLTVDYICFKADPSSISFPLTPGPGYASSLSVMSPLHNSYSVRLINCGDTAGDWLGVTATTDGKGWLNIAQTQGTLKSGETGNVLVGANNSILYPGTYSGSIKFTLKTIAGQLSTVVQVTLTVPSPTLTVTPNRLAPAECPYDSKSDSDSCTVTLTNSSADGLLDWSSSSTFGSVHFDPRSYPLTPGTSVQVTIIGLPACDQPSGASGTVSFQGPANKVDLQWSCPPG